MGSAVNFGWVEGCAGVGGYDKGDQYSGENRWHHLI